ncbi:MAG: PIN domain-containing protein [Longimicrobiales bacterium]
MNSNSLVFVDTNVLVYLRDSRDLAKQKSAAEWMARLWESRAGRVSMQVLNEYYVTVTAKLDPGLPIESAREDVVALRAWAPLESPRDLTEAAWATQDRWGFSFWDSLIVAAARAERCTILLTEDLSHGQDLDGLRVLSPFQATPDVPLG